MSADKVTIYAVGACRRNPGPGGLGIVMFRGGERKEYFEGFRNSTNNRMALFAVIKALEKLRQDTATILWSDSTYVVYGINKGSAAKWRWDGWMRTRAESAKNPDLWNRLLELLEGRDFQMRWAGSQDGNVKIQRAAVLARMAVTAARGRSLPEEPRYELPDAEDDMSLFE